MEQQREQQEQRQREEQRRKAAERRRQEKDIVQRQVLEEIAAADQAAHQQLQLAQQLATAVVAAAEEAVGGNMAENEQSLLPLANSSPEAQAMAAVPATRERGRPSDFTEEEGDRICAWIAEGRSLRSYCRLEGRAVDTIYRWLREHRDFRERYARAHDDRADSLADEITDIADEVASGSMEEIQAARLRVDARKWVAAKLKPTKWGDYQADTAKTNITFNIGIRQPHTPAPTIIDNPLTRLGS